MRVTSTILQTATRLIGPLALLYACYMALKGHNEPGGGFIGGLIAAVGLIVVRIAHGPQALVRLIPVHPRWIVSSGLGLALITAVFPLLTGNGLLRSTVGTIHFPGGNEIHYASAMLFDAGVLLVVVGVSVGMIMRLSEELES